MPDFINDPDIIYLPETQDDRDLQECGDQPDSPDGSLSVAELEVAAGDLLESQDFLGEIERCLDGRYAGPTDPVKLVALALYTRHMDSPVSVVLRGESSAGKSFAIKQALGFAAPEAHYALTAMSPKALIYSDVELSHRTLVLFEGEGISGDFASYLVRSLLSEGRLEYEVTDFEAGGTRKITKDGPTGLILSTAGKIDFELSTRMIAASIDDSPEITGEILKVEALAALGVVDTPDLARFHAFDRLLATESRSAVVPFALRLAELTDTRAVRMRRDFGALLGLIKAHALIHHRHRATNAAGEVLATKKDYVAIYELVSRFLADASGRSVPAPVRAATEAVELLNADLRPGEVTIQKVADALERDRSTASRHLNRAMGMGYVANVASPPSKKKVFQPADPLPDDAGVLPDPEAVFDARA